MRAYFGMIETFQVPDTASIKNRCDPFLEAGRFLYGENFIRYVLVENDFSLP